MLFSNCVLLKINSSINGSFPTPPGSAKPILSPFLEVLISQLPLFRFQRLLVQLVLKFEQFPLLK